jgi:hypothetical protein
MIAADSAPFLRIGNPPVELPQVEFLVGNGHIQALNKATK